MIRGNRGIPSHVDGWLTLYRAKSTLKNEFGARQNPDALADMDAVKTLAYRRCSLRDEDFDFADRESFALSLKAATRRTDGIAADLLAVIGSTLYEVSHVDFSRTEAFLYLTEVRAL